jgi:hypothetical protein
VSKALWPWLWLTPASCLALSQPPSSLEPGEELRAYWGQSEPACSAICTDVATGECLWPHFAAFVNCDGETDTGGSEGVCLQWSEAFVRCVFDCMGDCDCLYTECGWEP